jgi:hypothetical protein
MVSPNPSAGYFNIILAAEFAGQKITVAVYDQLGRTVLSQKSIVAQQLSIDLSNHPNGVYTLNLFTDKRTIATQPIVVRH